MQTPGSSARTFVVIASAALGSLVVTAAAGAAAFQFQFGFLAAGSRWVPPPVAEAVICGAPGTRTFDGGPTRTATSWQTPANWSGDALPLPTEHVCIPQGKAVEHNSLGTTSILSLQSAGSLLLSFGTLTLTDTTVGNESNATNFTQSAGTLDGAAGWSSPAATRGRAARSRARERRGSPPGGR